MRAARQPTHRLEVMGSENRSLRLADRTIGAGSPPFIVAELSGNHKGSLARALEILEAAKESGADAVKLQTYTPDTITIDHPGPDFVIDSGLWKGRTLYELYQEAHTPWAWHEPLIEKARELGICIFSSPFDATAVDFLETLDTPAYKIASFELVDLPLIRKAAATGKPMILSTGLASEQDIRDAVNAAHEAGAGGVLLLHCTSAYPTPMAEANLRAIPYLSRTFEVPVGLSDHTLGGAAAVAAVALGAVMIEKHMTMQRADGGPDASFSVEPAELSQLCADVRAAWQALGNENGGISPSEKESLRFRRSLYLVADVREGERLTTDNLRSIRPSSGLPPRHLPELLGRRVLRDIPRGTPMQWDFVD